MADGAKAGRLLAAAVIGVLLAAGLSIGAVARARALSSPTAVVQAFFRAVVSGHAAAALGYAHTPTSGRFLTDEVLREQQRIAPLTELNIRSVHAEGNGRQRVTLSYRLNFRGGPELVTDSIEMVPRRHSWRLITVAANLSLSITGAPERLTMAGGVMPARGLFFPGALPVGSDWPGIAVLNHPAVRFASTGQTIAVSGALTPAGRVQVTSSVQQALQVCLRTPVPRCPPPNQVRAVPGSLRGQLVSTVLAARPVITIEPGGIIALSATVSVVGSYQLWDFDNQSSLQAETVQIRLRALISIANPGAVFWQATG